MSDNKIIIRNTFYLFCLMNKISDINIVYKSCVHNFI